MYVQRSVYHDSSTKGFRHGIGHKRHDCWRGDLSYWDKIDGEPKFIECENALNAQNRRELG